MKNSHRKLIINGYNSVQFKNMNIVAVNIKDIMLTVNPNLDSFKSTIPAAQPPRYVRINVALGICINVEIEIICMLNIMSKTAKQIPRNTNPPIGELYLSEIFERNFGAYPFADNEYAKRDAAPYISNRWCNANE